MTTLHRLDLRINGHYLWLEVEDDKQMTHHAAHETVAEENILRQAMSRLCPSVQENEIVLKRNPRTL